MKTILLTIAFGVLNTTPALAADKAGESQQAYLAGLDAYQKGDYELARKRWEKAVALDPENADAQAGARKVDKLLFSSVSQSGRVAAVRTQAEQKRSLRDLEVSRDQIRIGSHKIEISPIPQSEGINGCLIAYGRPFPGPIRVVPNDQVLLINGVQVNPSLLAERQAKIRNGGDPSENEKRHRERILQLSDEFMDLDSSAWFFRKTRIRLVFLKFRDVAADVSVTEDGVIFKNIHTNDVMRWGFVPPGMLSNSRSRLQEIRRQNLRLDVRTIEYSLVRRGCVVITATEQIVSVADPHKLVNTTMNNTKLSREQKIQALEVIGGYGTALDIVENFSAKDWTQ